MRRGFTLVEILVVHRHHWYFGGALASGYTVGFAKQLAGRNAQTS